MTAVDVLRAIRAAGGDVVLVDGAPRLRASRPLPGDLVELAREHKAELVALLRRQPCHGCDRRGNAPRGPGIASWCHVYREAWVDLAASFQRAGMPRAAAERRAFDELRGDACANGEADG